MSRRARPELPTEKPEHAETNHAAQPRAMPTRRALFSLAVVAGLFAALPMLLRRMRGVSPPEAEFSIHSSPRELPNLRFADSQGMATSLVDFHGKVVLLNLWATWCSPCREEMPTLDRLQAALGGPNFEVVALSIDQGGMSVVQSFLSRSAIRHLRPYLDTFGDASPRLAAGGIPLTLLIDRDRREIGRKLGPAAWDHPGIERMIRSYLTPGS